MAKTIDGKALAQSVLKNVQTNVEELALKHIHPKLAVILVGEDPASLSYVKIKERTCEQVGIIWQQYSLPSTVSEKELSDLIVSLNDDSSVHGILVQLPLPHQIDTNNILELIDPEKDVDGFHPLNVGNLFLDASREGLVPCTPKGIIKIIDSENIDLQGKEITVVGHSNIVGKPLATMLLNRNATVTVCHSSTKDLKQHTQNADVVIVAVGKPNLITADMVKDGVIVIDIGCNKVNGKLCGDVDFTEISKKAALITPVPGGVGPMTVACLMEHVILAAKIQNKI